MVVNMASLPSTVTLVGGAGLDGGSCACALAGSRDTAAPHKISNANRRVRFVMNSAAALILAGCIGHLAVTFAVDRFVKV